VHYLSSRPSYNKEIKRLKSKVKKVYKRRKLGASCLEEMKQLSKQLRAANKSAQETILKLVLNKESKCWSEFYKYIKRRKGNRENIPAIKDCNGRNITDSIEKANSLNFYYYLVLSSEDNIPNIQGKISSERFTIDTKIIRKRIAAIGRTRLCLCRNFKTGWGSHDSIPCATI